MYRFLFRNYASSVCGVYREYGIDCFLPVLVGYTSIFFFRPSECLLWTLGAALVDSSIWLLDGPSCVGGAENFWAIVLNHYSLKLQYANPFETLRIASFCCILTSTLSVRLPCLFLELGVLQWRILICLCSSRHSEGSGRVDVARIAPLFGSLISHGVCSVCLGDFVCVPSCNIIFKCETHEIPTSSCPAQGLCPNFSACCSQICQSCRLPFSHQVCTEG